MYVSSNVEDFGDDENAAKQFAGLFGPGHVDQAVRSAINACWVVLPKDRKTPDELEKEIRRLFERALKDFRDDRAAFGGSK